MPSSSPLQTVRRFACSRDESASPAVLFPCRFPPGSIRPHPSTPRVAPAPPPREKPPTRLPLQTLPARSLPQSKTAPLSLPTPRTTPASANNRRLLREWPAPHLARCHTPVGHYQRRRQQAKFCQCIAYTARRLYPPSPPPEIRFQRRAHGRFVVNDQHIFHAAAPATGKNNENVEPCCGLLCTRISPPCCSITFLQTESPSPGLPGVVVKPGS